MNINIDTESLKQRLATMNPIIKPRPVNPIISCVRLVAANGVVNLHATNFEVWMNLVIDRVEIKEDGEAVVPYELLNGIVQRSASPTIDIKGDESSITLTDETSDFKVFCQPVKQWPRKPEMPSSMIAKVNGNALAEHMTRLIGATADNNSQYAVNGVLIESRDDCVTLTASNGSIVANIRMTDSGGEETSAIVPTSSIPSIKAVADEELSILFGGNRIAFESCLGTVETTLIDSTFVPYEDVLKLKVAATAVFKTKAMLAALQRAALLTDNFSNSVNMKFAGDKVKMRSRVPDKGVGDVTMELDSMDGEREMAFDPHKFTALLKAMNQDEITMQLADTHKAILRGGNARGAIGGMKPPSQE